ncbi:MAG TPA: hypothetical protein VFA67_05350 [Candidatus Sulfotelmatobacter sp.]|nr:hypothetical protein [Candidatus Sulfotelmatobacter sp.]
MRLLASLLFLFLAADAPPRPAQAIPYFTNVRDVRIAHPDRQNFFIVDEELWNYSRPDLADLRLYDENTPVQYALSEQRAGISSEESDARILNLGSVSGHTEFDLDAGGIAEYDRIRLRLDAHDFVATASVAGGAAPGHAAEVQLGPSTLYDFTKEQLGSNFQLKLPPSSFRYLHVKLSPGIRPEQVKAAAIYNLREQQASWTKVGSCGPAQQKQHWTVISCTLPPKVPLSRISFQIAREAVNFRRAVSVEDAAGAQVSSGEISRVRVNRAGTLVINQDLAVHLAGSYGQITINIDNGDNPPLAISAVQPLSLERRVYFDPNGKTGLRLYYGDPKLESPVYDFARFFHLDASAAQAELGPGAHNEQYSVRPDDRPWSERHTAILWSAMILAVLILAALALRGLHSAGAASK